MLLFHPCSALSFFHLGGFCEELKGRELLGSFYLGNASSFSTVFFKLSSVYFQSYMEDHLNNKDRLNKEWEVILSILFLRFPSYVVNLSNGTV